MKKRYLIHEDASYTGALKATLVRFEGTFRELLLEVNGLDTDEDFDPDDPDAGPYTEAQLIDFFNNANGDGQNYTTVFEERDGSYVLVLG